MYYLHAKVIGVTQPTIAVGLTERFSCGQEEKKKSTYSRERGKKSETEDAEDVLLMCPESPRESAADHKRLCLSLSMW